MSFRGTLLDAGGSPAALWFVVVEHVLLHDIDHFLSVVGEHLVRGAAAKYRMLIDRLLGIYNYRNSVSCHGAAATAPRSAQGQGYRCQNTAGSEVDAPLRVTLDALLTEAYETYKLSTIRSNG